MGKAHSIIDRPSVVQLYNRALKTGRIIVATINASGKETEWDLVLCRKSVARKPIKSEGIYAVRIHPKKAITQEEMDLWLSKK